MLDERQERVPEAGDVGDDDRLRMPAELRPGELLDQFLDGADAARERDEGVGPLEHHALALVHVLDDDEFLYVPQHLLLLGEEAGNDARDPSAGREHVARRLPHQPAPAAAIDEPDTGLRERLAEDACGLRVGRVRPGVRAAVDADVLDLGAGGGRGGVRGCRGALSHLRPSVGAFGEECAGQGPLSPASCTRRKCDLARVFPGVVPVPTVRIRPSGGCGVAGLHRPKCESVSLALPFFGAHGCEGARTAKLWRGLSQAFQDADRTIISATVRGG